MFFRSTALRGAAAVAVTALSFPASAGYVEIGGGWAAEWADGLDPFVEIVSNGVVGDAVFIQKSAEFTQGRVNGIFPSIPIVFRQISYDAVSFVVIDDEIIVNSTGEDWDGFDINLFDHGTVFFDPVRTLESGGGGPVGWSIDPFTTAKFERDDARLSIGGGIVGSGELWFPGNGPDDGQLWIIANPSSQGDPFQNFTLKETPKLPGPGGLALLVIGALASRRRR